MDSFTTISNSSPLGVNFRKQVDRPGTEAACAASRQKSCNACVRGKRRCDKRTPRCTRCAAKGLDCVYQRQPPLSSSSTTSQPTSSVGGGGGGNGSCSTPEMPPEFDMGFDIESLGTDTSPESLQQDVGLQLGAEQDLDFSIVDLMTGNAPGATTGGGGLWDLHGFGDANKMDLPPVPVAPPMMHQHQHEQQQQQQQQPIRDLSLLQNDEKCVTPVDVVHVYDPRSKLGYIVERMSKLHVGFSQKRETPFMHPRLWMTHMPRTILTAFSASASYATRTPETKGWAMKSLMEAVREVHRDGERAATHADKLARTQALLILNMMRIFDGDVGMRAAAEREMSVMLSWVRELVLVKDELEGGVPSPATMSRDRPPKSWESWILLESVRRTILSTYVSMCLFFILKGEEAPDEVWAEGHGFTASRHLWEAASSVDFYRAWREKPQYCVTDMSFKEFWMYARPDDLDEFTKMMLAPQVGVDAIEHFLMGDATIPVCSNP